MTWALVIWTAIFAIWIVAGVGSAGGHTHAYCLKHTDQFFSMKDCEAAGDARTAIGATLVFILWFLGFVVLGLVWLMSRPKRRSCPHRDTDVKKGRTTCPNCAYDFVTRQAGIGMSPPAAP
jgi:hypothetical protein